MSKDIRDRGHYYTHSAHNAQTKVVEICFDVYAKTKKQVSECTDLVHECINALKAYVDPGDYLYELDSFFNLIKNKNYPDKSDFYISENVECFSKLKNYCKRKDIMILRDKEGDIY